MQLHARLSSAKLTKAKQITLDQILDEIKSVASCVNNLDNSVAILLDIMSDL